MLKTGVQTLNLGKYLEGELNLWPFGLWDDVPNNWATLARAKHCFINLVLPTAARS